MLSNLENRIKQYDDLRQISMTGARAVVMLMSLIEGPKDAEEIKQFVINSGVVKKDYSVDTLRIDMNTLKMNGCEISKAVKNTGNKYILHKHPFNLDLTFREINTLKKVYDKLIKTATPRLFLEYHVILDKIAEHVDDEEKRETIKGISVLKSENLDMVKQLVSDEKVHNKVKIEYVPASSKEPVVYDVSIEKLGVRSGKLYVYCLNHTLNTRSFLNVSRIRAVVSKIFDKNSDVGYDVAVKFKLYNHEDYELEDNEILMENCGDYLLLEGRYYNSFIALQRMLSFSSDCIILEPENIRLRVINDLKEMRALYE